MASSNLCTASSLENPPENTINDLAHDLIESGFKANEWLPMREAIAVHQELHDSLQSTNDPLLNTVNEHISGNLTTLTDCIDNLRDIKDTADRLRELNLPPEAVKIINQNGKQIKERTARTANRVKDSIDKDLIVLTTSVKKDQRRNEQRDKIIETLKMVGIISLGIVTTATIVATRIEIGAMVRASGIITTQTGVMTAATITGAVVVGAVKDKKHQS